MHQGYTNYHTFLVCLTLDNDYGAYTEVQEAKRDGMVNKGFLESLFDAASKEHDNDEFDKSQVNWGEVIENALAE